MNKVSVKKNVFYLSRYPIPLTPEEVESLLEKLQKNDQAAKKTIVSLIQHRLNHRYIRPLLHIPQEYKSGFLIMAAACLLIEALQAFYNGKKESREDEEGKSGIFRSEQAFVQFFKCNKEFFPDFDSFFPSFKVKDKTKCSFFKHIRCGILHQAETTGAYRIFREGSLFSQCENSTKVNANLFLEAVDCSVTKYINFLRDEDCDSHNWKMAIRKLKFICENCRR